MYGLQILGFVADEEAHKYLYEGDFSLDSLKVIFNYLIS
jgi:hypothetical protein